VIIGGTCGGATGGRTVGLANAISISRFKAMGFSWTGFLGGGP